MGYNGAMRIRIQTAFACILLATLAGGTPARAGVILQGFYWDVPTPNAGTGDPGYSQTWWWDVLARQAHTFGEAGFTAVWLPPVTKGASGGYSVGYDAFDDYDIGSKWQNSPPNGATRYGTRAQLQRLAAMLKANGLDVYLDIVANHRNGDPGDRRFRYVNAYGQWPGGRFEKNPGDFHPNVPQDPNVPASWDAGDAAYENGWPFGPDLAPVNSATPDRYLWNGLNDAGDWLTKALDADGYRLDYVKGISTDWLNDFLNTKAMAGKFAVGEYYDGDLGKVRRWIGATGGRASAFDFPLRFALRAMCMDNGAFNMASLDHAGLAGVDPFHAVTFVENHDTDRHDPIVRNKMLAYAYVLTSEGYPCVFYRDYSTDPGCYGLKEPIDRLVRIHERIAYGRTQERWKSGDVFAFERMGGELGRENLLVALTDNPGDDQTVTVQTAFGPNVALRDYSGHRPGVTTDGSGRATITIARAGYVCYAREAIAESVEAPFVPTPRETTQEYAGASDLDIRPAETAQRVRAAIVFAQSGKPMRLELWYRTDPSWTDDTRLDVSLLDSAGRELTRSSFTKAGPQGGGFVYTPTRNATYTFAIQAYNTPASDPKPVYWLKAHYTAPPLLTLPVVDILRAAGGLEAASPSAAQYAAGPMDIAAALRMLRGM